MGTRRLFEMNAASKDEKIKQIIKLLKFVLTVDDEEITTEMLLQIIDMLEEME